MCFGTAEEMNEFLVERRKTHPRAAGIVLKDEDDKFALGIWTDDALDKEQVALSCAALGFWSFLTGGNLDLSEVNHIRLQAHERPLDTKDLPSINVEVGARDKRIPATPRDLKVFKKWMKDHVNLDEPMFETA
jgi:hypothetical protein